MAKKFYYRYDGFKEVDKVWWDRYGADLVGLSLDDDGNWYVAGIQLLRLPRNITSEKLAEKLADTTDGWSVAYGKDWSVVLEDNAEISSDLQEMHDEILKMV